MKRKSNITSSSKILGFCDLISGFVALALHSALAAKTDAAAAPADKTKRIRYTATGCRQPCSGGGVFRHACPERILGPDSAELVASQDPVEDKNRAASFAAKAKRRIHLPLMLRIRTALFSRSEMTIFLSRFQS